MSTVPIDASAHRQTLKTILYWTPLALILLLALVLRFIELDRSFWSDEIRTYGRATHGFFYAWSCAKAPIAYVVASLGHAIGDGETCLRLPFVLIGVLGVAAGYVLGKRAGGHAVGLVIAAGLAVSAYHIHWSQTARYYSLIMLWGVLFFWSLERALTTNRWYFWLFFTGTCAAGALTHLTFMGVLGLGSAGGGLWLVFTHKEAVKKLRWHRIATLVALTFLGAGTYFALNPSSTSRGVVGLFYKPAISAEVAAPQTPTGRVDSSLLKHRLSPRQYYVDFFKEFFPGFTHSSVSAGIFGAFVFWGLYLVLVRTPALGWPVLMVFLLLPVPLFFVDTTHFYVAQYFSINVPIGFMGLSVGVVDAAHRLARLLNRRVIPPILKWGLVGVVIAAVLIPPAAHGLHRLYTERPERDWREVARTLSQHVRKSDIIVYYSPWDWGYINFNLATNFYLPRMVSPNDGFGARRMWCISAKEIIDVAQANPNVNIWILGDWGHWIPQYELTFMRSISLVEHRLGNNPNGLFALSVLGEPTFNACSPAGFESPRQAALDSSSAKIELYGNENHRLMISNKDGNKRHVRVQLPLSPTAYPIRNGRFHLWNESCLVGWTCDALTSEHVQYDIEEDYLRMCEDAPVSLSQRFERQPLPGMAIQVVLQGQSSHPRQLGVALEYTSAGQRGRTKAYHSGSGDWEDVICTGVIPDTVDPGSIGVAVLHAKGAQDLVRTVSANTAQTILDPRLPYTLSFRTKHQNAYEHFFSVALEGKRSDGSIFKTILLNMPDISSDWRLISLPVVPGVDVPEDARTLDVVFELSPTVKGTLWVDNVQFEAKDHPTPFVEGVRPPHDETLFMYSLPETRSWPELGRDTRQE